MLFSITFFLYSFLSFAVEFQHYVINSRSLRKVKNKNVVNAKFHYFMPYIVIQVCINLLSLSVFFIFFSCLTGFPVHQRNLLPG